MLIPNKFCGYRKDGTRVVLGGKGGGAPAPDPALIAAQVKSMGIQDGLIQKLMANSDSLQPMQRQTMQQGIDASNLAMQQSKEDRTWAVGQRDKLTRQQNQMAAEADSYNEGDKADQLAGQASADVTQAFSSARGQGERALSRSGVDPGSGRALAVNAHTDMAQAAATAGAMGGARAQAKQLGYALQDRAMGALSGSPGAASAASGGIAGFGMGGINAANAGVTGMNSSLTAAGGLAGSMGSNATNMYGAQANFNLQNQQMMNNDPLMGMAGTAIGMMARSDIRHKRDITTLKPGRALMVVRGMRPNQSWRYKASSDAADGGKLHIGPMAQDVRKMAGERAAPGGTAIDLVNLNGLNMAATVDLSDKVDRLERRLSMLTGKRGLRLESAHG